MATRLLHLWLLLAGPLLLLLDLLHLNLLLLASVDSLGMVRVIRVKVVPCGHLLSHGHGRRRKYLFLLDSLFLLLLKQFLLFHALTTQLNFTKTSADIFEFEVSASGRAGVLLITLLLRINTLVVCEVNIVRIVIFPWFSCHIILILFLLFQFLMLS